MQDLETLRAKADELGIEYHHNIGAKKLGALIDEFLRNEVGMPPPKEIAPEEAGQNETDEPKMMPCETGDALKEVIDIATEDAVTFKELSDCLDDIKAEFDVLRLQGKADYKEITAVRGVIVRVKDKFGIEG